MKLDGIIILRITDFRRFFDFASFWKKREEFCMLIKTSAGINKNFFDTKEEQRLGEIVWTSISSPGNTPAVKDGIIQVKEKICLNEAQRIFYDQLMAAKVKNNLCVGLVALYKMLGYDSKESHVVPNINECLCRLKVDAVNFDDSYIPLSTDYTIPICNKVFPLQVKTIVNKSDKKIYLKHGKDIHVLKSNRCIVGVFHQDACYKLLPNEGKNENTSLSLEFDEYTKNTNLRIETRKEKKIEKNVVSFFIDEGGYAYVYSDGKPKIPETERFNFYSLRHLLQHYEGKKVIAIECENINGSNEYKILCAN